MRNPTAISGVIELLEGVQDEMNALGIREPGLRSLVDRALWAALAVENGQIIGKNAIDNGGLGPHALRRDREFKRDIELLRSNVVHIEDYRHSTDTA